MGKAHRCKTFPKRKRACVSQLGYCFILGPLFLRMPLPPPLGGLNPIQKIHQKLTGAPTRCQNFQLPQFLHILCQYERITIIIIIIIILLLLLYIHPKYICTCLYPYIHTYVHIYICCLCIV